MIQKIDVCSMIRHYNKSDFIEWVKYHLDIGFNNFIIIDNSSAFSCKEAVNSELAEYKNKINVIERPGDNVYQTIEFQNWLSKTDADWTLFIDSDEFLNLGAGFTSVHDFLQFHIDKNPKDMMALAVYWKFMGNNKPLLTRATTQLQTFKHVFDYAHHSILEIKQRTLVKSFFKKDASRYKHETHFPICNYTYDIFGRKISGHEYDDTLVFTSDMPSINHYYYKTLEEWYRKNRQRDMSAAGRVYPGNTKNDDEIKSEYEHAIKLFV